MHRIVLRFWKYILICIVIVTAWISFLQTNMVSPDSHWRYFQALYYSINLFIVGGVDNGFPSGGPGIALGLLWICYFVAPLLTLSFIYQIIQEKILGRISPWFSGHTVICGLGRNGRLIYDLIKEHAPHNHKMVLIEKDANNPRAEMLVKSHTTWWLKEDFTQVPVLRKARVHKADRIYITTNQDLLNLNTMVNVQKLNGDHPDFLCYTHIGNLSLHHIWKETFLREQNYRNVRLFNGYEGVTRRLYHTWVKDGGHLDPKGNIFMILGFGQFGQMLMSQLTNDSSRATSDDIVVVTRKLNFDLKKQKYSWAHSNVCERCNVLMPLEGDIHTPELWNQLAELIRRSAKSAIIFLCRDNDIENLSLAINMKTGGPVELQEATIFCRMYTPTAVEINDILEKSITPHQSRDIILFPMQHELKEAFHDELFDGARRSDRH